MQFAQRGLLLGLDIAQGFIRVLENVNVVGLIFEINFWASSFETGQTFCFQTGRKENRVLFVSKV